MKKIVPILLLIIVVAAGALLLKKRRQAVVEAPLATPMAYTIEAVKPETRTILQTSSFLAKLESVNRVEISSKLSGRISGLLVHESQAVRKGDMLVTIDDREIVAGIDGLRAQLDAAETNCRYSKTEYERDLVLFKVGGLSQEELEGAEVSRSRAIAAVRELEQKIVGLKSQLDYLNVEAPFDGIVGTIFLRQGDLAAPGRAILTLNSLPQKLTFNLAPGTAEIGRGQDVLLDGVSIGEVTTCYDDARNGLAVAEVGLAHRLNQPSGSYLMIAVVSKTATGCSVPIQALLHREQGVSVMLYQRSRFTEQSVAVKAQDELFAVIEPALEQPVAVAAEAKLSLLPTYGNLQIQLENHNE